MDEHHGPDEHAEQGQRPHAHALPEPRVEPLERPGRRGRGNGDGGHWVAPRSWLRNTTTCPGSVLCHVVTTASRYRVSVSRGV